MKAYYDVAQGSADWFMLRLGIPTASCFDQIITPVTGVLSKSHVKYAYRLIAERLLNTPMESIEGQEWMTRGQELEPTAVKQYEFVNEVETVPVGFITTDDGTLGCSPDRLIKGAPRGLEIKCPSPAVHLGYLLDGHPVEYRPQVQGQLYVAELDEVDFYSYHPRMPACPIRTFRDLDYMAKMTQALAEFLDRLAYMEERARSLGVFQAHADAVTPFEVERAGQLKAAFVAPFLMP